MDNKTIPSVPWEEEVKHIPWVEEIHPSRGFVPSVAEERETEHRRGYALD